MQYIPYVIPNVQKEKWKDYHGRQHGEINTKRVWNQTFAQTKPNEMSQAIPVDI